MSDTTERPPAREVLAAAADYYLVHSSDKMRCADAQLTALTAAGYPVEAGPALVEALEWYADPQNWKSGERAGGTKEFVEWPAMADQGYRARTTLAQQHEPTS